MTTLGLYSRAYPLSRLRQFAGWTERTENARKILKEVNGETVEVPRQLKDSDYVYLHTDFTVTDGIFIDENVIFNDVTPEWIEFCRNVLGQDPSHNGPGQQG
ncbi:MAG TPA: hypothetical protein VFB70_20265 [Pyrinomonadaceae bacterium]|jgi:hypothetical protein|nr:hypothetical protein [Pyrinomonadaceae bacterium]